MQAEGVVAGGSVAGVMETPPTSLALLAGCHGYDATRATRHLPPVLIFSYRFILLRCPETIGRFCDECVPGGCHALVSPLYPVGSAGEASMSPVGPKGVMTSSIFLPMADLSGRDVMRKNIPPSR